MLYEVKVLISYLWLYFANIVRTSTSGLDSKIVWFYASVIMNPIKLELKIDKRKSLAHQGCREGLGHFLSWWPFQTGQSPCWVRSHVRSQPCLRAGRVWHTPTLGPLSALHTRSLTCYLKSPLHLTFKTAALLPSHFSCR